MLTDHPATAFISCGALVQPVEEGSRLTIYVRQEWTIEKGGDHRVILHQRSIHAIFSDLNPCESGPNCDSTCLSLKVISVVI